MECALLPEQTNLGLQGLEQRRFVNFPLVLQTFRNLLGVLSLRDGVLQGPRLLEARPSRDTVNLACVCMSTSAWEGQRDISTSLVNASDRKQCKRLLPAILWPHLASRKQRNAAVHAPGGTGGLGVSKH